MIFQLGVSNFRGSRVAGIKIIFYSHIPFLLKNCEVSCKKKKYIYIYRSIERKNKLARQKRWVIRLFSSYLPLIH